MNTLTRDDLKLSRRTDRTICEEPQITIHGDDGVGIKFRNRVIVKTPETWHAAADALSRRDEALEEACIKADNEIWKVSPECWVSLIQRDELRIRVMDAIRAPKIAAPQDSRGNQHSGVPGNVPGNPSASNARSDGLPAEAATVVVPREPTPIGLFWQTSDGKWHLAPGSLDPWDIHDNGRPIHIALLGEQVKRLAAAQGEKP